MKPKELNKLLFKSKEELAKELFGMSHQELDKTARGAVSRVKGIADRIVNCRTLQQKEKSRFEQRITDLEAREDILQKKIIEELA